jgi:hypothetical protein
MTEIAKGKDAGDRLQVFCRDAQDDSPRCGLAPQRKSAWRSFRCRLLTEKCAGTLFAVNIRREFEKCKPNRREDPVSCYEGRACSGNGKGPGGKGPGVKRPESPRLGSIRFPGEQFVNAVLFLATLLRTFEVIGA